MTATERAPLSVDIDQRVAVVTLDRPEVRNALDSALAEALRTAVAQLEADDGVDVLILTGADPAFCAGVDLKSLSSGKTTFEGAGTGPFGPRTKLLIGAVNGPAVTGGLELALNCDFLVASERARFADTHARVGVMPGWGLTVLLPERVGVARAREMSTTGNFVDAHTALTWGLVNHVVDHDELLAFTRRLAADCSTIDQTAVRQMLAAYGAVTATAAAEGWQIEAEINQRWLAERFDAGAVDASHLSIIRRGHEQVTPVDAAPGSTN
jgi:enoyl-CoA hydratase